MPFFFFIWSDQRIAHLAANGVTPEEFEEVVCSAAGNDVSRTSGRPMAFGSTSDGRELVCIYEFVDQDTIMPYTAFEPEED